MRILRQGVKCDSCGWTKQGPARIVMDHWKKRCPRCGAANVIDTKDLIHWLILLILMLVLVPVEWFLINVVGKTPEPAEFHMESRDGKTYELTKVEHDDDKS